MNGYEGGGSKPPPYKKTRAHKEKRLRCRRFLHLF